MSKSQEYEKPSDHPRFDQNVVNQILELQTQYSTGVEIAAQLLASGVDIIPATLAFMHLDYRAGIYKENSGKQALHVEPAPGEIPPNFIAWSEFFLPKVIWDVVSG